MVHCPAGKGMSSISNHLVRPHIQVLGAGMLASLLAFLLALPACLGVPAPPAAKTITIVVDLPLTGDEGRAGQTPPTRIRSLLQHHPRRDAFPTPLPAPHPPTRPP